MDALARAETIRVLRSVGGDIPADTKLPTTSLRNDSARVINVSQNKATFSPLDLGSLKKWPMAAQANWTLARKRMGLFSGANSVLDAGATSSTDSDPSVNPFLALRGLLAGIGRSLDDGGTWCVIQAEDESSSVGIYYPVDKDVPAIVVLYRPFIRSTAKDCTQWIFECPCDRQSVHPHQQIVGRSEAALLYLKLNASLVFADFPVDKKPNEARFKPSVLLPVAPLDFDALSKMAHNLGCSVCGKKAASRCAQCQMSARRLAGAQASCKSLKGGRWVPITFQAQLPIPSIPGLDPKQMKYMSNMNKFSSFSSHDPTRKVSDSDAAPPNVWGDRVFMIKLQVGLGIYDDLRPEALLPRLHAEEGQPRVRRVLHGDAGSARGLQGMKMYRWAKRTGDWELTVCLDRQPQLDTKW
ncbi:hypothetical protein C8T65DRAFT_728205 [Cerioporus squamosus]|nr:hypothetical protein C8T65DRAFT_728205 [Cerioporus squamosus]